MTAGQEDREHRAGSPPPVRAAVDIPELQPLFDALRRGTKRSRLRLLVVVCSAGHTLLEVFPTTTGPIALWVNHVRWVNDEAGEIVDLRGHHAKTWQARRVPDHFTPGASALHGGAGQASGMACRCTEGTIVSMEWLSNQLRAGARRVIAPS